MICPARSCTRLMVVRGIDPFAVALYMPWAISPNSGMNWLGSGRRDRRSSWLVVVDVDMARSSLLDLSSVLVSQQFDNTTTRNVR